jgi:hypothetical protein
MIFWGGVDRKLAVLAVFLKESQNEVAVGGFLLWNFLFWLDTGSGYAIRGCFHAY